LYIMSETTRIIAVVGGVSGTQPHAVVEALLALQKEGHNFKIRAITRNAYKEQTQTLRDRGVEVFEANSLDKMSLLQAFKGCWGVFGYTSPFLDGKLTKCNEISLKNEIQQGINIIDAAIECNVSFFVYGSTAVLRFDTKNEVERYVLKNKNLFKDGVCIIRPVWFMDNFNTLVPFKNGCFSLPIPKDRKIQLVSFQDTAKITALAFTDPKKYSSVGVINLAGDELTPDEIAQIVSRESKHRINYRQATFYDRLFNYIQKQTMFIFEQPQSKEYEANIKECRELYPYIQTFEHYAKMHFNNKDFGDNKCAKNATLIGTIGCAIIGISSWYLYQNSK